MTSNAYLEVTDKRPPRNQYLTVRQFTWDLVNTEEDCFDLLRMNLEAFDRLVYILKGTGRLHDTIHCNVAEQLAIFLHAVAHNEKNRTLKCYFKRSGATISYYFNEAMYAIISLHDEFIKPPRGETPQEIRENPRFWPYFKDCVGAVDGTHIPAKLPSDVIARFRSRKGWPSQNVMAACSFDLKFTYVISGWEGSASDSRILECALTRNHKIQCPQGNKIDKGFKEVAYTAAANILNATFKLRLNKDNVINRMKTIKRDYRVIETMLGQSGFAFNYTTKKVECSDTVWETYAHPKVKNLRHKRIEMLEELAIVCGSDGATGEWCRGGPDINGRRAVDDSQFDIATDDNEIEDNGSGSGSDINVTQKNDHGTKLSQSYQAKSSACPTPRQHGKRVRKSAAHVETVNAMASSIRQMAEAMEQKTEIEAKKAKLDERVDPSMLLKTLEEIEGLNQDSIAEAFENLLGDEVKAKAFMTYSV
ncbi:hypothetical protein RHSIM_RhsimUnG0001400 [Rhododendron simsii]|uniref:DDE Tnp4 domain-containing protein n=1 Tax=Rhododendron simsii TaxID=118357 RepID=A0A834FWI4_RHOSS|nr:hypothetical protein RHSIM_RhsimUnG0001400 [Rhododendron simsii]